MPGILRKGIDLWLCARGFTAAAIRAVILAQIILLAASFPAGIFLLYWARTDWLLFFCAGAALFSLNFWLMSGSLLRFMSGVPDPARMRGQFLKFLGRIALLGLALAGALLAGARPTALLAGIFSALLLVALAGVRHLGGQA